MAYIDYDLQFSDAQALTATAASTNILDLSSDRDIGAGTPLWVTILVDVAADGTTGDETYSVALETDDNSSFSSATTIATQTITRGDAAGTRYIMAMPQSNERYLRLNYTLAGTTPTVTVSAYLSSEVPEKIAAYPDAL